MIRQYYLACLAHASYLVADPGSGLAAVVDPQRDVEQYVSDADALGCRIGHVFLTHFHADFVAGHLELRDRTGASIHLGAQAHAQYPFVAMADGSTLALGAIRLQVLETPGHSPESISILVFDPAESDAPCAVLTGDTLFVGDVGRPDLRAAQGWTSDQLVGMLYDSLHDKLARLPASTRVLPAHGAGSLCGRNIASQTSSTIGEQLAENPALAPMSRERFAQVVTSDLPDAPPYFTYDALLNASERPTLPDAPARQLRPLSLAQALALVGEGAQLLDTREPADFGLRHLRGSVNVGLGGNFASWCGTVLSHEAPIVLVADPGREREAAMRLGRIGFDTVAGYLDGGLPSLPARCRGRTSQVSARSLAELLAQDPGPLLIDVRGPGEYARDAIDTAVNVPLTRLADQLGLLPRLRPIVVYCATGYRSSIAASLLMRAGFEDVANLTGGLAAWTEARAAAWPGLHR